VNHAAFNSLCASFAFIVACVTFTFADDSARQNHTAPFFMGMAIYMMLRKIDSRPPIKET
jgi:hypothetical protein